VLAPTWVAPEVMRLARRAGGTDLVERGEGWEQAVAKVRDAEIWRTKRVLRERLVVEARRRLRESARQRGGSEAELGWSGGGLAPGGAGAAVGRAQARAARVGPAAWCERGRARLDRRSA